MTEQQWLQATDPRPMLDFLKGKASDRKLRLFAVACCRRVGHLLSNERMQDAVETAERFADGLVDAARLRACLADVDIYDWLGGVDDVAYLVTRPLQVFGAEMAARLVRRASHALGQAAFPDADFEHDAYLGAASVRDSEAEVQAGLLRCVFGPLPFRPLSADPAWLTWREGLLVSLARHMYEGRDFADLPMLGDALEETGCADEDILGHCRQREVAHARGCFVVDLLTGKS
jgi:hypothetical protein